jgi:hypothetical protein
VLSLQDGDNILYHIAAVARDITLQPVQGWLGFEKLDADALA